MDKSFILSLRRTDNVSLDFLFSHTLVFKIFLNLENDS